MLILSLQDWVRSLSLRRMYNRDVLSWCQVSIVLVTIQIILTTLEHKNILPTLTIIKYILTFYFYIYYQVLNMCCMTVIVLDFY